MRSTPAFGADFSADTDFSADFGATSDATSDADTEFSADFSETSGPAFTFITDLTSQLLLTLKSSRGINSLSFSRCPSMLFFFYATGN